MRGAARWARLASLAALPLLGAPAAADEERAPAAADEEPIDLETLEMERAARAFLHPVRARISRYLEAAAKAVEGEGGAQRAHELLGKLDLHRLNPYERALVHRLSAHVHYSTGDFAAAIESFERVLAEEVLPVREDNRIRFNIAQLQASQQKWRETLAALDRWSRYVREPDPLAHYLRGIAHYQLGELDRALAEAEQAVDLSPDPPEGWLQLLAALYAQKQDYARATPVLEELVVRFPKERYWIQLSLIYGAREEYRHSLAVQQVAYLQGFLRQDKELRRLARGYLYNSLPYPAARVLEKGLAEGKIGRDAAALELLANSWIAAREYEKALSPLGEAAELSENGNLYVRLGQVYMQREEWARASEMLQKAVRKGELKDTGSVELLLGICSYNEQRVEQARSYFARARQHDSTREAADRWLTHIDGETGAETGAG
jgi:tetratricopeptide (TPR) repeat protein